MRKVLIGLIAFGIVLLGFWGYVAWMDTPPIQVPHATDAQDMDIPPTDTDPQPMGDTTLEVVGRTRYFKYDPVTKEAMAEYGFQLLLNPGEGSSRWRVEKPYLVFYQPDYQCRIDSERGTFQVETAGSQSVPKDAQLDENVVIHITSRPGSRINETTIYMDDLTFSSERSEFATDGPVTVQSIQLQLEGHGLVLIFNTGIGKVEYLQIKDLDFLRLKGFASSNSSLESKPTEVSGEDKMPSELQPADQTTSPEIAASEQDVSQQKEPDSSDNLYRCDIRDNVMIQYGNELVVSGADQVDILNIRPSSMNDANTDDSDNKNKGRSGDIADAAIPSSPQQPGSVSNSPEPTRSQAVARTDESQDVIVNCDGGMIFQPMQRAESVSNKASDSALAFEMSGTPLKIGRVRTGLLDKGSETLAHCGALYYKPTEDILRLFTNKRQPQILLNTQESNSRIETNGNVFWDRKAQRANIAGPGKVYIGNVKNPTAQPSEISFDGVMDLLFAQMPDDVSLATTIRTINFTGGMDAILRQNGTLKTLADSAVLEFGRENELSEARLDGDVHFESFEAGKSSSQAAAESAIFHFDNNQISTADLKGAVHFVSASGQMDSSNARIEFDPDSNGTMHPKMIRTNGDSVLQSPSSGTEQPSARFEAKKIDYDMQTGTGLAHGPIRFTFYQPAQPDAATVELWVPVTITADESAQFRANTDRTIKQVVFNKNVIALRILETSLYTQRDEFHGDKLIVDVDKNEAGSAGINRITFTQGRVFGQSKKLRGEEILFNVRLTCKEMVYDQTTSVVLAKGPGQIQLDNSNAEPSNSGNVGINFRRPCYALIEGFDTIQWDLDNQQIAANGDEKTMQFAYVPLINGEVEKYIFVNSQTLDASYQTDAFGTPAIKRVFTDKAITYVETDRDKKKILLTLVGQTLEYNAISDVGWLTITGSEANPCFINGNRTPAIRYNVNTGQFDASLSRTPGVLSPLK
ncbi:MAG: hypothetical protein ISS71_00710 [Phycisphaerae bacterium]|nr:hypothetical protein [Phycisphaerae bacterium]